MTLQDILKAKGCTVLTIGPDATLQEAVDQLVSHNVGSLIVCERDIQEGERLLGIITERDILHAVATNQDSLVSTKVSERMSRELVTASPSDAVEKIMGLITNKRVRHLPVLVEGRLVGMVSIGDLVKNQCDQLSMENQFMKDYIQS